MFDKIESSYQFGTSANQTEALLATQFTVGYRKQTKKIRNMNVTVTVTITSFLNFKFAEIHIIFLSYLPLKIYKASTMSSSSSASTTTYYLVTGASSGIGMEFVRQLALRTSKGPTHVIATCRKKASSVTGADGISALKAAEGNEITILEGIDVCSDDCKEKLLEGLPESCKTVDVVIHNAGGMGTKDKDSQSFENVTPEIILNNVNLNGIGPLRIQQALHSKGYMGGEKSGGKVVVITSGLSSINDNTSGGYYAYRGSKAFVNMVFKSLSCDLKPMGISVMAIAPSFVQTEFGGFGKETLAKMGAIPVEMSVGQMIQAIDDLSLETTGKFMSVDKNGTSPKEFGAGW